MPTSPASYHSAGWLMRPTAICAGHIARGADRSALRQRGARALGFPRWHRARRSHAQAFPPPLTMLEWNNGNTERVAKRVSRGASAAPGGLRAGAGLRIGTVGPDLALARQAAFFPSAGGSSRTNS